MRNPYEGIGNPLTLLRDYIVGFLDNGQNIGWLLLVLGVTLVYGCARNRRWPETDDIIELFAYGGGVWGAAKLLVVLYTKAGDAVDLAVSTGGAVAVGAMCMRGMTKVLWPYIVRVEPVRDE